MTEAERTALVAQFKRVTNFKDGQIASAIEAVRLAEWQPPETPKMTQAQTETPARCEPPEGTKNGTYHVHDDGNTQRVCKWANQRWYNSSGRNSQTAGEAADQGWRYSHAVQMGPPVPDPHAALRDAVVEAAMAAYYNGWLLRHIDDVSKSCAALAVAQAAQDPPAWVPVAEVPEAWKDGRELVARFHGDNPCPCVIVEYTQSSGTWCGDNGDVVVSHLCDCIPRREP